MSAIPFIRVLIVRVLDDDFVERSPAAPVHHEARVHYAVGQEPVVLGGVVVAAVLQDALRVLILFKTLQLQLHATRVVLTSKRQINLHWILSLMILQMLRKVSKVLPLKAQSSALHPLS